MLSFVNLVRAEKQCLYNFPERKCSNIKGLRFSGRIAARKSQQHGWLLAEGNESAA